MYLKIATRRAIRSRGSLLRARPRTRCPRPAAGRAPPMSPRRASTGIAPATFSASASCRSHLELVRAPAGVREGSPRSRRPEPDAERAAPPGVQQPGRSPATCRNRPRVSTELSHVGLIRAQAGEECIWLRSPRPIDSRHCRPLDGPGSRLIKGRRRSHRRARRRPRAAPVVRECSSRIGARPGWACIYGPGVSLPGRLHERPNARLAS